LLYIKLWKRDNFFNIKKQLAIYFILIVSDGAMFFHSIQP